MPRLRRTVSMSPHPHVVRTLIGGQVHTCRRVIKINKLVCCTLHYHKKGAWCWLTEVCRETSHLIVDAFSPAYSVRRCCLCPARAAWCCTCRALMTALCRLPDLAAGRAGLHQPGPAHSRTLSRWAIFGRRDWLRESLCDVRVVSRCSRCSAPVF